MNLIGLRWLKWKKLGCWMVEVMCGNGGIWIIMDITSCIHYSEFWENIFLSLNFPPWNDNFNIFWENNPLALFYNNLTLFSFKPSNYIVGTIIFYYSKHTYIEQHFFLPSMSKVIIFLPRPIITLDLSDPP